jgi:hypothetical protein
VQCNLTNLLGSTLSLSLRSSGLHLSNCYLQIDDKGTVIEQIRDRMRKIAHVPIQTWKGWNPDDLLGGWFSAIGGFKTMFGLY